jgi:GT2 family glycosyltransferase
MTAQVGVILVNYGDYARRFLPACRDSLRAQSYPPECLRVYIVDNASTPGSREYLRRQYPEAVILPRPDGNYAAANNLGLRRAHRDGCDYLVAANLDTVFDRDWLRELVAVAEAHPEAGLVQSKILLYPRSAAERRHPKLYSLGGRIHYLGFGLNEGYGEPDREVSGTPEIPGFGCGCALLFKPRVLDLVGGYNEAYYMYHDDLELGWKARWAGETLLLAPRSRVFHKYEVSRSVRMSYYLERNRYLTLFTFYRPTALLLLLPALLLVDLAVAAYWGLTGRGREKLRVYAHFCRRNTWRDLRREQRELRRQARVWEGTIIRDFAGALEFQHNPPWLLKKVLNPCLAWYWRLVRGVLASRPFFF